MTDDELGRLLGAAFDARARAEVGDHAQPPEPRFATVPATLHQVPDARAPRRWVRVAAPLVAAAAVLAIVLSLAFVSFGSGGGQGSRPVADGRGGNGSLAQGAAGTPAATVSASSPSSAGVSALRGSGAAVRVKVASSGAVVGVGMPVVAYFSRRITSGRALQQVTRVTVNGAAEQGAWYFGASSLPGYPIEGHLRLQSYWPADAKVHVSVPVRGLTAGAGLQFATDVSLDFSTGAQTITTVDDRTHMLTVRTDGKLVRRMPVSLGGPATPTRSGIKVVMAKGASICMSGPGYHECGIQYTQRLTADGEYLHSAPWNVAHIQGGVDSSNGCTNLLPADAKWLFDHLRVGDVVTYPNAKGSPMRFGNGLGDWDVPWAQWRTGGTVPTS